MKKFLSSLILLLALALPFTALFKVLKSWAGPPAANNAWDATYELSPTGTDALNEGDDWMRAMKKDFRYRLQVEHDIGELGGAPTTDAGRHLEGSARAWRDADCDANITTTARTDYNNGAAGSNVLDEGRLCKDTTSGEFLIHDGAGAWTQALSALSGTIGFLNGPLFGSGATATDSFHPLAFTIRNIGIDNTLNAGGCATPDSRDIALQVFGDGNDACYSVTLDLSTRTAATSRVLVFGQLPMTVTGGICASSGTNQFAIYRNGMTNIVGPLQSYPQEQNPSISFPPMSFSYITNLSNASHEFALHAEFDDSDCSFLADANSGGFLAVIDLGPVY